MIFCQILDRLGEWRECGRYAGTMQQGEEINIPCPPYDCKFVCFSLEASSVNTRLFDLIFFAYGTQKL